jgi:L-fucose isomerase-like protein
MKDNFKLGLSPTRRNVFSKEDAWKQKKLIEDKLKEWKINYLNIDWLNNEGLLYDIKDVKKVATYFRKEGIDALFCPHVNFGTEAAVAKLGAELNVPYLLWGPRDDAPLDDGTRTRDSQCGLFATSKILRRFKVPFTYIVNSKVDSEVFKKGFFNFIRAANVVKAFRKMKIGQISTRPKDFWTVMYNESELLEKFGIEIVPISLVEIVNLTKQICQEKYQEIEKEFNELKQRIDIIDISDEKVKLLIALKLAMLTWVQEEELSGIAIQCWNALQDALGIMPCFANAELTDMGIPVACETDIHGAITAVMTQAAFWNKKPTFFADLTIRQPENDNAELLWHCGSFPYSLKAEDCEAKIGYHFIIPTHAPGVAEWRIKGEKITITRFDGDNGQYKLLIGEGKGVAGPYTKGTYIWVEFRDWPKLEEKVIYGPYIHHVIGIHGEALPVLYEAIRYIPGLEPDLVDETEETIKNRLR